MDDKELLMLIGEQTLLSEEHRKTWAERQAQLAKLLNLYNDINACHGKPMWLERGVALLQALHATQTQLLEQEIRINEIKRLTGRT